MARPAIEKLPDLEDYLGSEEKAQMDADRIKLLARSLRTLNRDQVQESLKDGDRIPGTPPMDDGAVEFNGAKFRSFKQQRDVILKAYVKLWEQIEEEGYRALVEDALGVKRTNGAG